MAFHVISIFSDIVEPFACNCFLTGRDSKRLVVDTSKQKQFVRPTPDQRDVALEKLAILTANGTNRFFLAWDGVKMFFQVPQHWDTDQLIRLTTFNNRTYVFNRLIMGGITSMYHLNEVMDQVLAGIPGHVRYADDGRLGSPSIEEHYKRVSLFLDRCIENNLLINPAKFEVISTQTYWCGHVIDQQGHRPDPRAMEMIEAMPMPRTGEDLTKALGAMRWLSTVIPNFAVVSLPLQELLKQVSQEAGSQKKTALRANPCHPFGPMNIPKSGTNSRTSSRIISNSTIVNSACR